MDRLSLGIPLLGLALAACDKAGDLAEKALDANNNTPGEADGRVVEVSTISTRTALAADDKEYFVVAENGDVMKRPHDSGAFTKIGSIGRSTDDFEDPRILLDADNVWYYDSVGVVRIARSGGAPEDMKVGSISEDGFVQNDASLFIVTGDHTHVARVDKKAKTTTPLATVFKRIDAIVADGDRLIVADSEADTVSAIAMNGEGDPVILAKDQAHPREVGVGGGYVYWYNGGIADQKDLSDRMLRIKSDGSGTPQILASLDTVIANAPIVADESFVYYQDGSVFRIPAAGGAISKFVNLPSKDYLMTGDHLVVLEDNALKASEDTKDKPNRVVTVTK